MDTAQQIPSRCIELFFRVRAGHSDTHFFAYYLEYLTFHIPVARLEAALEWLIKNKIVGAKFVDFISNDCARSGLEMIRHITMRLERDKKIRPLYATDLR